MERRTHETLRRGLRRLLGALSKRRSDRELADELASHIEMQAHDNLRAGMSPAEAVRAARLEVGGVESVKESYRDQRGLPLIESSIADLRYVDRGFETKNVVTMRMSLTGPKYSKSKGVEDTIRRSGAYPRVARRSGRDRHLLRTTARPVRSAV